MSDKRSEHLLAYRFPGHRLLCVPDAIFENIYNYTYQRLDSKIRCVDCSRPKLPRQKHLKNADKVGN